MKRVKRPEDLFISAANAVFPFNDYVRWLLDTDQRLNVGRVAAKAAGRIEAQLERGGDLFLEDTDAELLKQANEQPSNGYPQITGTDQSGKLIEKGTARHIVPYLDAIEEMKECKVEDAHSGNGAKEDDPSSQLPEHSDPVTAG